MDFSAIIAVLVFGQLGSKVKGIIKGSEYVTCGSVVKLLSIRQKTRLHSHDVKYGSGSGQQSVTGMTDMEDHNSHWAIQGKIDAPCKRGDPVACGATIRLHHSATGCHLHSHHFPSPLSKNQEVSCFGSDKDSDTGDHWVVLCDGDYWERKESVQLKHVDTGMYLATSAQEYGRPINGQKEICAIGSPNSDSTWRSAEGLFIMPSEL